MTANPLTSRLPMVVADATYLNNLDRTTLLLVANLLDEILNALELWQRTGDSDWTWVARYWSRKVMPWIGVELPRFVRDASDAATLHRALLAWQREVIDALTPGRRRSA